MVYQGLVTNAVNELSGAVVTHNEQPVSVRLMTGLAAHLVIIEYRQKGYPLGKSRRGLKKFIKKRRRINAK